MVIHRYSSRRLWFYTDFIYDSTPFLLKKICLPFGTTASSYSSSALALSLSASLSMSSLDSSLSSQGMPPNSEGAMLV